VDGDNVVLGLARQRNAVPAGDGLPRPMHPCSLSSPSTVTRSVSPNWPRSRVSTRPCCPGSSAGSIPQSGPAAARSERLPRCPGRGHRRRGRGL